MNSSDIHSRIIDLAKEKNMTLYGLAKASGLSVSGLYNMHKRKNLPKIETLEKICVALDNTMSDFFVSLSKAKEGGRIMKREEALLEFNRKLNVNEQKELLRFAEYLYNSRKI